MCMYILTQFVQSHHDQVSWTRMKPFKTNVTHLNLHPSTCQTTDVNLKQDLTSLIWTPRPRPAAATLCAPQMCLLSAGGHGQRNHTLDRLLNGSARRLQPLVMTPAVSAGVCVCKIEEAWARAGGAFELDSSTASPLTTPTTLSRRKHVEVQLPA